MLAFAVRRLSLAVGVLAAVSLGTFIFLAATRFSATCASRFTPAVVSPPLASNPRQATILWLDWLEGVPSGRSFGNVCNTMIGAQLWPGLEHTAALLGASALIVICFSLLFGTLAAARAGSGVDWLVRVSSYAAWAVPSFLFALILQSIFRWLGTKYGFHALGIVGWPGSCLGQGGIFLPRSSCPVSGGSLHQTGLVIRHLVLPAVALAVAFVGVHTRYLRSSLIAALAEPYTRTARAKGLREWQVLLRHALRNSLATFASSLLLDFGAIFGAAMAVDWVFQLNGLGTIFISEIAGFGSGDTARPLNPYAIESLLAFAALLVVGCSFLAEVVVASLDPRVKLR